MVFGFLDDGEGWPAEGFGSSLESDTTGFDENDEEKENGESLEESKSFWETQIQILQVSIFSNLVFLFSFNLLKDKLRLILIMVMYRG